MQAGLPHLPRLAGFRGGVCAGGLVMGVGLGLGAVGWGGVARTLSALRLCHGLACKSLVSFSHAKTETARLRTQFGLLVVILKSNCQVPEAFAYPGTGWLV